MIPPIPTTPATDTDDDERLRGIWNEQRKLEATFLNNIGVAIVITGFVTPVLANLYGLSSAPSLSWLTNGWLVLISLVAGFSLNRFATGWLKGLG